MGVRPGSQEEQLGRLAIAAVLVLFLPQLPFGNYLLYPFTILTTWFHEMGHGLAAITIGWDFERLVILPTGSGYAETTGPIDPSAFGRAWVSAGGPLAPNAVGALLILASARIKYWKPALLTLAAAIAVSALIWVRSMVGLVVLPGVAILLTAIALRAPDGLKQFALQFVGVIAALSMLRDWDYLFSYSAVIGGRPMLSDTGAISEALFLPYWIWAGIIIAISGLMVGASLKVALRRDAHGNLRRP